MAGYVNGGRPYYSEAVDWSILATMPGLKEIAEAMRNSSKKDETSKMDTNSDAQSFSQNSQTKPANSSSQQPVTIAPQKVAAWASQFEKEGFALQKAGRHQEAIAKFSQILSLPQDKLTTKTLATTWYHLGSSYSVLSQFSSAIDCLRKAASAGANCYTQIEKCENVVSLAAALLARKAQNDVNEAAEKLGSILHTSGEYLKEACPPLLEKTMMQVVHALWLRKGEGDLELTVQFSQAGLQLEPKDPNMRAAFLFCLGDSMKQNGNPEEALDYFEQALALPGLSAKNIIARLQEGRITCLDTLLVALQGEINQFRSTNLTSETGVNIALRLFKMGKHLLKRDQEGDLALAVKYFTAAGQQKHQDSLLQLTIDMSLKFANDKLANGAKK